MKKRVFSVLLCLCLTVGVLPAGAWAAGADGTQSETIYAPDLPEDFPDNDELFAGYVWETMYGGDSSTYDTSYGHDKFAEGTANRQIYDQLVEFVGEVASGQKADTKITIDTSGMNVTHNNGELVEVDLDTIFNVLLADCTYKLYWFDKTMGWSARSSTYSDGSVKDIQFEFTVSKEYATDKVEEKEVTVNYPDGTTKVEIWLYHYEANTNATSATSTAVDTAKSIVDQNKSKSEYNKLVAYKTYICNAVSYHSNAADDSWSEGYGNPWQMIYVFDNNEDTNVVCEGYAKAFQYLCDLSGIECYTVSGKMSGGTGAGGHMWNIVRMGNASYLVDVTNCDTGTVGATDKLFMVGTPLETGTKGTYKFDLSPTITYTYYENETGRVNQYELWGEEILALSSTSYVPKTVDTIAATATPTSIEVPKTGSQTVTLAATATYTDNTTEPVNASWAFGNATLPTGVTLSGNTLTITPKASVGSFTVTATYDGKTVNTEIKLTKNISDTTINLAQTSVIYDGTEKTPSVTVIDENKTLVQDTDYTVAYSKNISAGNDASVTLTGKGNYTGTATKIFTIEKARPTFTPDGQTSVTVGENYPQNSTINTTAISGSLAWFTDAAHVNSAASGKFTATGKATLYWVFTPNDTNNYNTTSGSIEFTVSELPVATVEVTTPVEKTYGDANFSLNAVVKDNAGNPQTSSATLSYTSSNTNVATVDNSGNITVKNAGSTNITVTAKLAGHTDGTATVRLTVNPREITITAATLAAKTYDGTPNTAVTSVTFNGILSTDSFRLGTDYTATAAFTDANAGEGKNCNVVVTLNNSNYTLTSNNFTATGTISKAPLAAKSDSAFLNTTKDSTATVDLSKLLPKDPGGTVTYGLDNTSGLVYVTPSIPSSNGILTLTYKGETTSTPPESETFTVKASMMNYEDLTINVTVTYTNKAVVALTLTVPNNLVYNGTPLPQSVNVTSGTANYTGPYVYSYTGTDNTNKTYTSATAPTNAGTYTVTVTIPESNADYAGIASQTFTIERKPVIVTAKEMELTQGAALPTTPTAADYEITGLVNGDTLAPLPTGFKFSIEDTSTLITDETVRLIGAFLSTDGNYSISYQAANLSVVAASPVDPGTGGNTGGNTGGSGSRPTTPTPPTNPTTPPGGGSTTTVTPSATVSNGTASAQVSSGQMTTAISQAKDQGSDTVVIAPQISGSPARSEVTLPASSVGQLGSETSADLTVKTPAADVTLPNGSLDTLANAGGSVVIATERSGDTIGFTLTAGGAKVDRVPGGVKVSVPAADAVPGTVAVLVKDDGTREILRKSAAVDGSLRIPLDGSARVEIVDNSKSFQDVPADSWASGAVAFASSHELFNGTSASTFSPDTSMTRGMLAVVLHNLENNPTSADLPNFPDVSSADYFAQAVTWAAQKGIVQGYADGTFGAGDSITREQLAVMLYRSVGSPAVSGSAAGRFSDAASISAYAQDALNWAVENGILNGMGNNVLNPQGNATRAQVAQMMKNFVEAMA